MEWKRLTMSHDKLWRKLLWDILRKHPSSAVMSFHKIELLEHEKSDIL